MILSLKLTFTLSFYIIRFLVPRTYQPICMHISGIYPEGFHLRDNCLGPQIFIPNYQQTKKIKVVIIHIIHTCLQLQIILQSS